MKRREGRGFWAKCPLPLRPPVPVKQGRGAWAPAAAPAGGPGHGSGRGKGEERGGGTGNQFPSSISKEGARREGRDGHSCGRQAAAVGGVAGAARGEHR